MRNSLFGYFAGNFEGFVNDYFLLFYGPSFSKRWVGWSAKYEDKGYISITKARKLLVKLGKSWQKYQHDK